MKIRFFGFLLCLCFLVADTVCAATVDVNWKKEFSYLSVSHGYESVTQFNVSIDGFDTYGFCVAPAIGISRDTYQYDFLDWTTDYLQAAWLMDNYVPTASTKNARLETVVIQSGIWAAVTNDTGYAPRRGKAKKDYTAWYASIPTSFDSSQVAYLEQTYKIVNNYNNEDTYQTLIVKYPSVVPVPSAVWLLGSGLIGLFGLRTRRRS